MLFASGVVREPLGQALFDKTGRLRASQKIALGLPAMELQERGILPLAFDAFRDYFQITRLCYGEDGLDQRANAGRPIQAVDERRIDFEGIDR